ncbi:MAG TPA: hypothetical protein VGS41_14120 [Chthonomonadales bacterium]|nr:hypothetical protein [Chthonomonadales bacterium]
MADLTDRQKAWIDRKLAEENLNEFGDSRDTAYAGGSPLFNMLTGEMADRYQYILSRHKDWRPE